MEALSIAPSGCVFPSARCPLLRAGHQAAAAAGSLREQACGLPSLIRSPVRRSRMARMEIMESCLRYALLSLVSVALVLVSGCDSQGPENRRGTMLPIDGKVIVSIAEGWFPWHEEGSPDVILTMNTERNYPCCNYSIEADVTVRTGSVYISLEHIYVPEICLTSPGPASYQSTLALGPGTYELVIEQLFLRDTYTLVVTESKIQIEGSPGRLTTLDKALSWRVPAQSFVYLCGTTTELSWMCDDFLDSLLALGSLQEFSFPDSGVIPYQASSSGHWYDAPGRFLRYGNEADFDSAGAVLQDYVQSVIGDSQGIGLSLTNWQNKQFRSWLMRSDVSQ